MKQFFTVALLSIASLLLVPPGSLAQEEDGLCFMTTSSGQRINLGSLCPGGEGSTTAPKKARRGVFQAPIIRRSGGTPIIEVIFNGTEQFDMIVDTGASGTLITQRMARSLGIKPHTFTVVDTASEQNVKLPVGKLESIEVDGAVIENVNVAIAGPELDVGLLGHDFFGQYDVTFKENIVEFRAR